MTSRERFLAAVACQPLDRPPVWLMRQAGRYLPEYRALKEKHSFVEMVRTPELATEVTLQPLRRFELDAAIIFSDILVIPEALGQPYRFKDGGGIEMEYALKSKEQIIRLSTKGVHQRLDYVARALQRTRSEIGNSKALLGFCGSPWTLAAYMTEGGSPTENPAVLELFRHDRPLFNQLMAILTESCTDYLKMQIDAGADAVQIFDSWASLCPDKDYREASLRWINEIIAALPSTFPIILFAKGMAHQSEELIQTGARVISYDWTVDLAQQKKQLPADVAVQGNLNPDIMTGTPEATYERTTELLESMRGLNGHIFNLGHGLTPQAKVENVQTLVETVCHFR
jgi:uroporphyrinogen decarboxylase